MARESERVLAGESQVALRKLALIGGSPQGARPKALIQYDARSDRISTRPAAPGKPWLVKFPARGEHKEVCAIEQLYAELARDCGLNMPATACFDLSEDLAAFGAARFDREQGRRVPMHSLAGLLQVDFRMPGVTDYTAFLRATRMLTRDMRELEKAYAQAVFNVLFHNRDDHPKNFAWRLGEDRRWRLAPAFDLTFSEGPMGQHQMDVCGAGDAIERRHLLQLADAGGVSRQAAERVLARMLGQAAGFAGRVDAYPLRRATGKKLKQAIAGCRKRLEAA